MTKNRFYLNKILFIILPFPGGLLIFDGEYNRFHSQLTFVLIENLKEPIEMYWSIHSLRKNVNIGL